MGHGDQKLMIVVTATLLNANGRDHDAGLGVFTIINNGAGSATQGDYDIHLKIPGVPVKYGSVEDFPRLERGVWELLRLALNDLHERGQLP